MVDDFQILCSNAKSCVTCSGKIPFDPNPVFNVHKSSKILIIGQAPGTKVQTTGIPWNDPSGDELRRWMDLDRNLFYDPEIFGILPMGLCYPGKGKSGDLPPRPECAPLWHPKFLSQMQEIKLILLIGQYAQAYYLGRSRKENLTETVKSFRDYLPKFFPLVHPSPRNRIWQKRNPWFEEEVIPELRKTIFDIIQS